MNIVKHRFVNGWLSSLILATLFLDTGNLVYAQARRPGVTSLGELGCKEIQGGMYKPINEDVSLGFEIFRAVGFFGAINGSISDGTKDSKVACRLAGPGENPTFKTLTLSIGFPENHYLAQGSLNRLSIYKDGQFYEYRDLAMGQKVLWVIDVTNTRTLGLHGECIRKNPQGNCPAIYFFEDLLE
ncbi:hypothetical protein [Planktothrix mougeotii]|uniref:DUF3757 domain-containing protein n=1 Tax=Planktothrix mougeotii LEGE 06226 TaxID=1828728 RepID=A0ABR9UBW7_9CYAN|nr:hypothetical protein [Planktothrix mougeotii]MBE9143296.1 hypothetical protein [Planktothrix mougeotii LEGE 06226]